MLVELIPVGGGPLQLARLARGIEEALGVKCRVREVAIDAEPAYHAARDQYYSTMLLAQLDREPGGGRLLGVTAVDLFVPIFTFVFGEAQVGGRCALVSSHRLREEFYGLPENGALLEERLLKESLHELGHTFGLRHCDHWDCVMASTHAVERLDVKLARFCGRCRRDIVAE